MCETATAPFQRNQPTCANLIFFFSRHHSKKPGSHENRFLFRPPASTLAVGQVCTKQSSLASAQSSSGVTLPEPPALALQPLDRKDVCTKARRSTREVTVCRSGAVCFAAFLLWNKAGIEKPPPRLRSVLVLGGLAKWCAKLKTKTSSLPLPIIHILRRTSEKYLWSRAE